MEENSQYMMNQNLDLERLRKERMKVLEALKDSQEFQRVKAFRERITLGFLRESAFIFFLATVSTLALLTITDLYFQNNLRRVINTTSYYNESSISATGLISISFQAL